MLSKLLPFWLLQFPWFKKLAFSGMENCADMDNYQYWAWNDLNCETAQASVIFTTMLLCKYKTWVCEKQCSTTVSRVLCARCLPG